MIPFTKDEDNVYINAPYMELYVPDELFGDPSKAATIACEYADGIKVIGILNMRLFTSEDQDRSEVEIKTLNYPNVIETYPSDISTETLTINDNTQKFRVLKYLKGDILMKANIKMSSTNCEFFLNLLTTGKIPSSITPDNILSSWIKNFQINGTDPGVPYLIMQMIISEMYRYSKDPVQQFRKVIGNGDDSNKFEYITANMNQVSSYSSVMSALTFERFSDKLTTSINMTKSGVKQNKSPIEKVLSM